MIPGLDALRREIIDSRDGAADAEAGDWRLHRASLRSKTRRARAMGTRD